MRGEIAKKVNTYLGIPQYLSKRTANCRSYVTMSCALGGVKKTRIEPRVDEEEEEKEVP